MRRFSTPAKKRSPRLLTPRGTNWNFDIGELEEKTKYFWKLALGPFQVSYNKQKVKKNIFLAYV